MHNLLHHRMFNQGCQIFWNHGAKHWRNVAHFFIFSPVVASRVVFVGGGVCPGHWNSGSPQMEFSFVSHGGMVNIPLTGTGKLLYQAQRGSAVV